MATTRCPHCNSTSFEMVENSPRTSRYRLHAVQCASCGAPFTFMEYHNIGRMMEKQNEALKKIARAAGVSVDLD